MLQSLQQLKYGSIPESIAQRIQAADSEELLHWSQRILSADSLADIFAQH